MLALPTGGKLSHMSKHLESLKTIISPDETILAWCSGSVKGDWPGILALTTKRWVYHRKGWFDGLFGGTTHIIPLDKVGSVHVERSFGAKGTVKIHTSGAELVFRAHDSVQFAELKAAWEAR